MIPTRTQLSLLSAAAALVLGACDAPAERDRLSGPSAPQTVAVTVEPPAADAPAGARIAFAATVTGTADTAVVWSVVEQGGGTVDSAGVYTAPAAAGTFRVRATSHFDAQAWSESVVTVRAPVAVAVAIAPRTVSVVTGGTVTFSATVTNAANPAVSYSVLGTSCGSVTSAGVYTAPASARTCTVVATSQQDSTKSDSATVTVTAPPPPITVALSPSPGATDTCRTLAFTATVTGSTNTGVTWAVQEGAAGGAITSAGLYTAPDVAGTYHVVATSVADATRSAAVAVTVTDRILSVAVSPAQTTVQPGATARFTATVTTTCGSFTAAAVAAPGG